MRTATDVILSAPFIRLLWRCRNTSSTVLVHINFLSYLPLRHA